MLFGCLLNYVEIPISFISDGLSGMLSTLDTAGPKYW